MKDAQVAVAFEGVTKSFGALKVLDDISFEVFRGTAFCLLGRSGSGKSVTIKQMIGLLKPDRGRIWVEGEDIAALDSAGLARVRKEIGFLFQYSALFDSISVGENVAFPLRRHTNMGEDEIRDRATKKLRRVGLEGIYDKMPSDISGGMRKRVGLARALVLEPALLLADEPSSGLDPITSREIDELFLDLKHTEGTTMVIVTHNIPSARSVGDELAVLHQGRILASGSPAELDRSEHAVVREFMQMQGGV
ncbi:MAG TPA: ATP-binding cassette domain-containing protein [Bryobacteraceae bacterium]|nr:ATP-binding cassette domain-containing protein [Bryobacteraceae bacterium]